MDEVGNLLKCEDVTLPSEVRPEWCDLRYGDVTDVECRVTAKCVNTPATV
jgi:hypothetical protein